MNDDQRSLLEDNLDLVILIAEKYAGRGTALSRLIQKGNLGLIDAAEKYDPSKGYEFRSFAAFWIRRAISSIEPGE
jgi:RNA polymerase primary sigma factor